MKGSEFMSKNKTISSKPFPRMRPFLTMGNLPIVERKVLTKTKCTIMQLYKNPFYYIGIFKLSALEIHIYSYIHILFYSCNVRLILINCYNLKIT